MTTTKKMPTLRGRKAGKCAVRMPDNFTLVMPVGNDFEVADRYIKSKSDANANLIAHPARPTVPTGHFCTETARVQQQTDAQWLAEYDAADSLVHHHAGAITPCTQKRILTGATIARHARAWCGRRYRSTGWHIGRRD